MGIHPHSFSSEPKMLSASALTFPCLPTPVALCACTLAARTISHRTKQGEADHAQVGFTPPRTHTSAAESPARHAGVLRPAQSGLGTPWDGAFGLSHPDALGHEGQPVFEDPDNRKRHCPNPSPPPPLARGQTCSRYPGRVIGCVRAHPGRAGASPVPRPEVAARADPDARVPATSLPELQLVRGCAGPSPLVHNSCSLAGLLIHCGAKVLGLHAIGGCAL